MTLEVSTDNPKGNNNWYVITGGPGSGKTTLVNLLHEKGYKTTFENARHYIDTKRISGSSVEEILNNHTEFQSTVLEMQIQQEKNLNKEDMVFLDRAIPDALAYYLFLGLPIDSKLNDAIKNVSYKKVFILDLLPLVNDYARREDETEQKKIHALITQIYKSLPFPVVFVPVLPPEQRVKFILNNIEQSESSAAS